MIKSWGVICAGHIVRVVKRSANRVWWVKLKEQGHFVNLSLDTKIIFTQILKV
jgi:hypothetical protein